MMSALQLHQELDWSGIKAAAISLDSVNAAAVQAGANLPPDEAERLRQRINKRALREKWLETSKTIALSKPSNAKPLSQPVQTGADSIAAALAEDSNATKTGFSRMARRVAEAAAGFKAPKALKNSRSLRDVATIAGQVHGWDAKTGDDRRVMINIGILTQ